MKKTKTFIAAIGLVLFGFVLGACGMTAKAEQIYPLKIYFQNDNGMCKTWNVVDENTGVNYVVVTTKRSNADYSVAITPRLKADGSLYVSE